MSRKIELTLGGSVVFYAQTMYLDLSQGKVEMIGGPAEQQVFFTPNRQGYVSDAIFLLL
jgi:hypothetical protein